MLLLSSFGYDVVGLDFSPDAVRMAEENRKSADSKGLYKPANGLEKGDITWISGDFFSDEWNKGLGTDASGTFDLIYDYTVRLGHHHHYRDQRLYTNSDDVSSSAPSPSKHAPHGPNA